MTSADPSPTGDSGSASPTIGVEEEFILVDRTTGHPVDRNREVAAAAARRGVDLDLELTSCQVEIATSICSSSRDVASELRHLRSVVADAADEVGVGVIAAGVPPTVPDHFPITDTDRYRRIGRQFGMLAHEQGICGCHIHIGVPDRDIAVEVGNRLRARLPALLALSANSAIYRDADTGHASWRSILWSRWPAAGPPPHLRSREHFEDLVAMFVSSGAILDDHMVYWDIRPSDHLPTIEIRVGDVQSRVSETVVLATLVRALVMHSVDQIAEGGNPPPPVDADILAAALWKAAHDGLDGDGIDVGTCRAVGARDMIAALVADVGSQLDVLGDRAMVDHALKGLVDNGNGATRQRRSFGDGATSRDIVAEAAREFTR
ncbi:carboxylate-amine ligase [Gordonia insulae]|uniref:Putative glutamate--cysteine ligase 2 n=1 Tax=Gordonia insulae TaxID=2420509 RepID=A0A3G8JJ15_9ACTN|nr:glutamate--cysteine ligase [Gordonia insulae]AZG44595.1 Putative glutamate--cysteine ligase 2 [Gordonia insulae]